MQHQWTLLTLVFTLVAPRCALAKDGSAPRARPPQWSQEVRGVFFDDVQGHLVGNRPSRSANTKPPSTTSEETQAGEEQAWSALVDADTLVTEIKRMTNHVAKSTSRAGAFKSEGHRLCQRDFRLLAVWFGVVSEFDEEIRWKRNAPAMRDYLLATAHLCKPASDESFAIAQEACEVLAELMRGQSPAIKATSAASEELDVLGEVMWRMEQVTEEKILPAMVGVREFRKASPDIVHEAQVMAVLARIIQQEGFDYSEDETYCEYAMQLQQSAADLSQAARNGDLEGAEQAQDQMEQSCVSCHEDFRG